MDTINGAINISILLIVTYFICYFIVYVANVYDLAAKGRGSVLDNPYLAKFLSLLSSGLYYVMYYFFQGMEGTRIFILNNISFRNGVLSFMVLLSLILCMLYIKIY